jgi:hypothetical protein
MKFAKPLPNNQSSKKKRERSEGSQSAKKLQLSSKKVLVGKKTDQNSKPQSREGSLDPLSFQDFVKQHERMKKATKGGSKIQSGQRTIDNDMFISDQQNISGGGSIQNPHQKRSFEESNSDLDHVINLEKVNK